MTFVPSSLTPCRFTRNRPESNLIVTAPRSILRNALPRTLAHIAAVVFLLLVLGHPAKADFRLCNNTGSRVGVALGYKDAEGWTTEGWWNVPSRSCETLLRGGLVARYYYIYAVDYDRGGEWSGKAYMCTRDKEFTIRGTEDCLARGYDRTGYFEVDTSEQRAWTVQLTDTAEQAQPDRVPPRNPLRSPGTNVPPAPPLAAPPAATPPADKPKP
jgi:uncharacterized membrane protein